MASEIFYRLPDAYRVVIHWHSQNDANATWRNSYELHQTAGFPAYTDAIITAIVNFARYNSRVDSVMDEVELRHVEFGNVPFSEQGALWRQLVNLVGQKSNAFAYNGEGTTPVGGEVVANILKTPQDTGKIGRLQLRNLLDTDDIQAFPGGPWEYKPSPRVTDTALQNTITNAGLAPFFSVSADPNMIIVRHQFNSGTASATALSGYTLGVKVSVSKQTRKSKK